MSAGLENITSNHLNGQPSGPARLNADSANSGTFTRTRFTRTRDCMALAWPARAQIP